jgi:cysteinyl-tRNA synthetase
MISPIFFNTLTRQKQEIKPLEDGHLKIYVCGPTVYDRPHLGNARSIVIYDLLFRFFKEIFPRTTYVRNITDVDDKINAAALEQKISIQELTQKIINFFNQDISALNVLKPDFEPKATQHIGEMIDMIERLIASKHAYVSEGHVLFDVNSYKNYGALSNRNLDELISGARIEIAAYKKNPLDFVLWKPASENDDISSVFTSPWGKGRPGWHIECSAMSEKYLGANFDIHGGGADLQFPHHENEIAQSCCANPNSNYAQFWIHNGFLTVNGEKMSKSLKNFITVRDLLDKKISGATIRFLLLSSHYRKPLDFSEKALEDAQKSLEKFYSLIEKSDFENQAILPQEILIALADDLNFSKVSAFLHELTKQIKSCENQELKNQLKAQMAKSLDFLGFKSDDFFNKPDAINFDENYIEEQIALRTKLKQEKNYALADEVRNNLLSKGIILEDVAGSKTIWKIQ